MCAEKDIQLSSFGPQSHLVKQAFFPFLQIRKMKLQKVIYSRKRQRITQSMSSFYRWKSRTLGNRLILLNLLFCSEQVLSQMSLFLFAFAFFHLSETSIVGKWSTYLSKSGRQVRGKLLNLAQDYQNAPRALSNLPHPVIIHPAHLRFNV